MLCIASPNVLQGVLQSKLITSKKHTYGAGYVIQTTKCVLITNVALW